MKSRSLLVVLVAAALTPAFASAQPYNPYYRPYGWGESYLSGFANTIQAVGDLNIKQEQARIEREKAEQAKMETRKKALDTMLYEKAYTPTYGEQAALVENQKLVRMMTTPQPLEIREGKTLNQFLPFINQLAAKGIMGPPVPLDPYMLSKINVTLGADGPNVGLLRQDPIDWPMALRNPIQKQLAPVLKKAVIAAAKNELDQDTYRYVQGLTTQLDDDFNQRYKRDMVSVSDWMVATPFLEDLKKCVQALGQPGVGRLLDGSYSARGSNVPELAMYMISNGLTFSPAAPGGEAAYRGLHNAFVGYIRAAQASSGFQIQTKLQLPKHLQPK
jgi:hypothetical protein